MTGPPATQPRRDQGSAAARRPVDGGQKSPDKSATPPTLPPRRTWTWFLLVLLVNFLVVRYFTPRPDAPIKVPYTLFKEQVKKRNVQAIYSRGEAITGRFSAPVLYPPASDTASPRLVAT